MTGYQVSAWYEQRRAKVTDLGIALREKVSHLKKPARTARLLRRRRTLRSVMAK